MQVQGAGKISQIPVSAGLNFAARGGQKINPPATRVRINVNSVNIPSNRC